MQATRHTQYKGKNIKDYYIQQLTLSHEATSIFQASKQQGGKWTMIMVQKRTIDQTTFVQYHNMLAENTLNLHPKFVEIMQTSNNIYLVVEHISLPDSRFMSGNIIGTFVELYGRLGQYKIQKQQLFFTDQGRLVYLPMYKPIQKSSQFYAQFHNKSVLGQLFSMLTPHQNKNIPLDIFIRHIDHPQAVSLITQQLNKSNVPIYPSFNQKQSWQDLNQQDQDRYDQQIMQLMSKVQVNANMKKQAGDQFLRQSSKRGQEQQGHTQIKGIIDNVQSSMFDIKAVKSSKPNQAKMEVRVNQSKVQSKIKQSGLEPAKSQIESDQFDLYFRSYCQSLRFMKGCIKHFLSHYKKGFSGIICAYFLTIILTLRKAYMVRDLQCGIDIFQLKIDMTSINIGKYVNYLKRDVMKQAKMILDLRNIIENCKMPMKTYQTLVPYLQQDLSVIDYSKIHTFFFFVLTVLMKGKKGKTLHEMYVIDLLYILLHKSYEISFFQNEFPNKWDEDYFETKVVMISMMVPNWKYDL